MNTTALDLKRILVVDDEPEMLELLCAALTAEDTELRSTNSAEKALEMLRDDPPDLVVSDLVFPSGMDGLGLLEKAREIRPGLRFIMVSGNGSVESAVKTLKYGAFDYLVKPFDPEALIQTVDRFFAFRGLELENERLRSSLARHTGESALVVGSSEAMRRVMSMVQAVAPMPTSVLIRGESGTGKELIADELHRLSPRADKRLVKVNCAALPENLLEDELFGHEKGAFTSASGQRIGRFEDADGGTIFLDEIGEMSPLLQAKLLRVLQEKSFQRVGSNETIKVDVRIICATNRDLESAVAEGEFREDLYYRINVVQIQLPPLRERREDIPMLAEAICRRRCLHLAMTAKTFRKEALQKLQEMDFPGNVRELQNLIERMLIFCRRPVITVEDIPDGGDWFPPEVDEEPSDIAEETSASPALPIGTATLEDLEREAVRQTLKKTGGNMYRAAKLLDISRSTLYSKVRRYGLEGVGKEEESNREGA